MCSIAELNGDESLQGVCWTLAFGPLLLFIFVSHFLRRPFLPLLPSHSCLLPHFFSPLPQSLPFPCPSPFSSSFYQRVRYTIQTLLRLPRVAEWLSRQALDHETFVHQNGRFRLTRGHRGSSELEVARFQEHGLKLVGEASGFLGVKAGPFPPTTASPRCWRHAHLLKGGGRPGSRTGCGEGTAGSSGITS